MCTTHSTCTHTYAQQAGRQGRQGRQVRTALDNCTTDVCRCGRETRRRWAPRRAASAISAATSRRERTGKWEHLLYKLLKGSPDMRDGSINTDHTTQMNVSVRKNLTSQYGERRGRGQNYILKKIKLSLR